MGRRGRVPRIPIAIALIRRSLTSAAISTMPSNRRAFPSARRALSISDGRNASASASTMRMGARISAGSSRFPPTLTEPLALRYHGHQFRVYNPDIGDGRGFTLRPAARRSRPVARPRHQGLGPDAYSRTADGRLTSRAACARCWRPRCSRLSASTRRKASPCSRPARRWSAATSPHPPARRC